MARFNGFVKRMGQIFIVHLKDGNFWPPSTRIIPARCQLVIKISELKT